MSVDAALADLVWRGIEEANPWWPSGTVPAARTQTFRRAAFSAIYQAVRESQVGRGVVVLGPRRIGKTVLLHQVVEQLLADGVPAGQICFLSLDDVALRDRELGELLDLVELRRPRAQPDAPRVLLLDEVQHSKTWAGWLKRLADRRDPYTFLATGSSATALRRGGQDAGLGRWREMTLFPWSFKEHVTFRKLPAWTFTQRERLLRPTAAPLTKAQLARLNTPPANEAAQLDAALVDYFVRGGFPEVAAESDLREARRKLRQDILDRSLGRDITDVANIDSRLLERLFLRICLNPGGLWSEVEAARDLQVSRPTITRYLQVLEEAFLVFRLPNLASPVKGQPKIFLVAPSMRQALLSLGENDVRRPGDWGQVAENAVAAAAIGTSPDATEIGFWRKSDECDVVLRGPLRSELIEVKRSGQKAARGIDRAAKALGIHALQKGSDQYGIGFILCRDTVFEQPAPTPELGIELVKKSVAAWLFERDAHAGGTLRIAV